MRRRLGTLMLAAGVAGAVALTSSVVSAQRAGAQKQEQDRKPLVEAVGTTDTGPLPPGGPTPRMADGKPDLSGIWFTGVIGRPVAWSRTRQVPPAEEPVPLKPEIAAKFKAMSAAEIQAADPTITCLPRGVPAYFTYSPPTEVITYPGVFVQLVEAGNSWRKVYTNKRPHPKYPEPLFNGNSSAWWEGDTLIIDSIGFDKRTWVQRGFPHGENMHLIERLRRPSKNYLEYQFTVEDPEFLTRPWTSAWRQFTLSQLDGGLVENYCTNEQNSEQFDKLIDQEKSGNR